jgi:hypothetical protein
MAMNPHEKYSDQYWIFELRNQPPLPPELNDPIDYVHSIASYKAELAESELEVLECKRELTKHSAGVVAFIALSIISSSSLLALVPSILFALYSARMVFVSFEKLKDAFLGVRIASNGLRQSRLEYGTLDWKDGE